MDERRTDQERNGGASQARTWPLPGNGDPHRTTLGHVGNDGSPQTSRGQATRSSHHQNSRISPEQHEPTKLLDLRRQYNETH
ncbi:MAG TPA: hypothetical protein VFB12_30330, partial [Ktedonobacteraceae bacterium]|nr:hypothetical protein [Ktedonobacteraceae bacterium]